jgi:hypothetical protein
MYLNVLKFSPMGPNWKYQATGANWSVSAVNPRSNRWRTVARITRDRVKFYGTVPRWLVSSVCAFAREQYGRA